MDWIITECKKKEEKLLDLRRRLHRVPEIGGHLPKTRKIVCDYLDGLGIAYTLNATDHGVVAQIEGTGPGKTLAFRADMDALHIEEEGEQSFCSQIPGQMHGCGHDAHTAMLLIAAELLMEHRQEWKGRVRLLFQTGEETGTGAKEMLANGALEGVDAIAALHVGNIAGDEHQPGDLIVLGGPVSAGKNKFTITVNGKGTHSAFPEKGIDPILIAARIVNGCEEIMARELPAGTAAVLSFGSFQAGLDHNTIPETAVLRGSIRVQDEGLRDHIGQRLKTMAEKIAEAFGATCCVELKKGSVTVVNDEALAAQVAEAATKVLGKSKVVTKVSHALMGSDDFANYASRIPGAYIFLHTNNPQKGITEANHSPRFDIEESVLWEGVATYVALVKEWNK